MKNSERHGNKMRRKELERRMDAMINSLSDRRVRCLIGKSKSIIEKGEMKPEEFETLMEDILQTEMERKMILNELRSSSLTISEISRRLEFPPKQIFNHLMALRRLNVIAIIGERKGELEFQLL